LQYLQTQLLSIVPALVDRSGDVNIAVRKASHRALFFVLQFHLGREQAEAVRVLVLTQIMVADVLVS